MPLYEYRCEQCGELFEVRQKFADEPLTVHEKCKGKAHRLISVPALQFKGSGFYITDYAKGSAPGGKNGDSSPNGSSSSESSGTGSSSGNKAPTSASESKPSASSSTSSSDKKASE